MKLEIAVQDVAGITIAAEAGVDRVELCSALALGGITPSAGLVEAALAAAGELPVHVLVRPRPGDFDYTDDELRVMEADVRAAVAAGAAGVVVGAMRGREVDTEALARLVEAAGGADVTFHRAFDLLTDPVAGLAALSAAGVRRVLTSGGGSSAVDGLDALRRLVAAAGGIEIMAGGGVTIESIAAIGATGADAVHLSAKRIRSTPGGFSIGSGTTEGVMEWDETDPGLVARARAAAAR